MTEPTEVQRLSRLLQSRSRLVLPVDAEGPRPPWWWSPRPRLDLLFGVVALVSATLGLAGGAGAWVVALLVGVSGVGRVVLATTTLLHRPRRRRR